VIHKHPAGLPHGGDLTKIIQDPGTRDDAVRYEDLPRNGNRVQAALDLVLEDGDCDRTAVLRVLSEFEQRSLGMFVTEPVPIDMPLGRGRLRGIFTVNLGPMDLQSTRAVFSLLIGTIDRALAKNHAKIAA
jgi:hypothetical protein